MPEQLLRFAPFPAYHVRTNAFMLDRATFARLRLRPLVRKMDAYLLESGRASFTSQVQSMGLRTLVVARDGSFYDHPDWYAAETFWQGQQRGSARRRQPDPLVHQRLLRSSPAALGVRLGARVGPSPPASVPAGEGAPAG